MSDDEENVDFNTDTGGSSTPGKPVSKSCSKDYRQPVDMNPETPYNLSLPCRDSYLLATYKEILNYFILYRGCKFKLCFGSNETYVRS